jgi:hypothetical protein
MIIRMETVVGGSKCLFQYGWPKIKPETYRIRRSDANISTVTIELS